MKVVWKTGYAPKVDPVVAYNTIQELHEQGRSDARGIVDASRPVNAPLHPCFEWDDSIAAEKYREEQARLICRSIIIVPEEREEMKPVRAFFNIETQRNTPYEPTVVIMECPDKRERLLNAAKRELESFAAKYSCLQELDGVIEEIRNFINNGGDHDG